MRDNQPVTNEEYIIPDGVTLVTKTDLHGTILEVNDSFELASGFTRDELVGEAHSLVRHPDVPAAVFKDLWHTISKGGTWSQIVKNRRKDGGFYWVRANITPIFKNQKVVAYLSYRTLATKAEISAASIAYKQIASGKAKIQNAKIYTGIRWAALNPIRKLKPHNQLLIIMLFTGIIPLAITDYLGNTPIWEALGVALFFILPAYALARISSNKVNQLNQDILRISSLEKINFTSGDNDTYYGRKANSVISVAINTRYLEEKALEQLDKSKQLEEAIHMSSSNIMITDNNLEITFLNDGLQQFLEATESTIQTVLPDFKAKNLVGTNIDVFHHTPAKKRNILKDLDKRLVSEIVIGNTHIELIISPIYNRNKLRVGLLAEWRDKTQDVMLVQNIGKTIHLAAEGIFDQKIDLNSVEGLAKEIATQINELLASVETPINEAILMGIEVAKGNFNAKITSNMFGRFDLLKTAMNVAIDNTSSLIGQTKQAITSVKAGAVDIGRSSTSLNDRTQEQAAALEETAASMEQITSAVQQNSDNAQQATEATHDTAQKAHASVKVMEQAIQSMEQIHESSQKINDIISLIDSIAFQTNLLALNAAVEAARAGDHGRGFAVVAGEVRALAGKSADAAKDIRGLIEDTVKKVDEGSVQVKNSGSALTDIVEAINRTNQITEEIATSSKEQSIGVSQVNQAITSIDGAVQQNASLVEESTQTAISLDTLSANMENTINAFHTPEALSRVATPQQTGGLDLAAAKRAHRTWRVNVLAYLNDVETVFPRETAADGTKCALGLWLYGDGKIHAGLASYQALEKGHLELHSFIGSILDLKDIGDMEKAIKEANKLEAKSDGIMDLIDAFEKDLIKQTSTTSPQLASQPAVAAPKPTPKSESKPTQRAATSTPAPKVQARTAAKAPAVAKPTEALQTPAPSQPKLGQGDEWGEF